MGSRGGKFEVTNSLDDLWKAVTNLCVAIFTGGLVTSTFSTLMTSKYVRNYIGTSMKLLRSKTLN